MRVLAFAAVLAVPAGVALPVARAEDDLREQAFPWPVATFDVPAPAGASVSVRLDAEGTSRTVVVGPHAALVVEWGAAVSRHTPDPETTLELLRSAVAEEDQSMWKAARGGAGLVVLSGPGGVTALAEQVTRQGSASSTFALRIVVLPDEQYLPPREGTRRTRFGLWPGTRESFDEYRRLEAARWREARAAGTEYVPTTKERYVAPRDGADPSLDSAFEVLETPAGAHEDFDGSMLDRVSVGRDQGTPVTLFEVAPSRQAALEAWTRRNVGLPVAIVLDGRVMSSPIIMSPLSDSVQVTLGGDWQKARSDASRLMTTLLRARAAALRTVLVVGPWSAGRRLVHIPLPGAGPVDVRIRAGGEAHGVAARAYHRAGAPGQDDVAGGLRAALALGALDSDWARALVARFERPALLAALHKEHGWTDRVPIQADLLELLGHFGADDGESMRLVILASMDPRNPPVQRAARRALARASSGTWLGLLENGDAAVRALATGASAQIHDAPPSLHERWRALRQDPDVDVRVLARWALVLHGADEPGERGEVEGFLGRHPEWRWASVVRERLRQAPR